MDNLTFSQRIGEKPVRESIQIDNVDEDLTIRLWNVIVINFFGKLPNLRYSQSKIRNDKVCLKIWTDFLGKRADEIFTSSSINIDVEFVINNTYHWFAQAIWYDKYDFLEYLAKILDKPKLVADFSEACNTALKRGMAGYRIIGTRVVQITSNEEVVEIEQALTNTSSIWQPVNIHLKTAIGFLSDREPGLPKFNQRINFSSRSYLHNHYWRK
ncbi:AbiJ-NTD4 domain-containing protein [Pontibacter burrus]|uniref:HEPN AbiJ-N-terminal domain-containing protein n=1 Tax=Pontibacter burrus TaxID=2704466 RepID=A0A6B3LXK3_9BACT|nr:hypothetical protein [Pontibacter burrus]NEM98201.1 hypothetical protein [Pontibacter burrus]